MSLQREVAEMMSKDLKDLEDSLRAEAERVGGDQPVSHRQIVDLITAVVATQSRAILKVAQAVDKLA